MITKYIAIGMLVFSGVLGVQNYYLNQKNDALVAAIEVEKIAKQTAEKRLEKSQEDYKEYYTKYFDLRENNSKLELDLKNNKAQLDDYKRREYVVLKKPTLVERRINAATKRLFNEYACITGNSGACKDNKD